MSCCPRRDPSPATAPADAAAPQAPRKTPDLSHLVPLPGARFEMGSRETYFRDDGESPPRLVRIKPFAMSPWAVTNAEFAQFIDDTGYETDAERFGWTYVFAGLLDAPDAYQPLPGLAWWRKVDGATWNRPEGPGTRCAARMDHPVVHVSHRDATAYAAWAGGRLPTEAEWEYAASGGVARQRFPWGDREPDDSDFQPCNIWQGRFPDHNTGADGYVGTAPAVSFAPNGFGLYNMCGNTWEWSADRFRVRSLAKWAKTVNAEAKANGAYVIKGGSFLCHKSYCYRYRVAARSHNTPDSTTSHSGFRIVADLP